MFLKFLSIRFFLYFSLLKMLYTISATMNSFYTCFLPRSDLFFSCRLLNLNLFLVMPYLLGSKLSDFYWVSCKRNSWHYNITCIHKKKINLAAVTFPSSKSCNSCGSYWRFILCGVILKGTEKINSMKRIII